MKYNVRTMHSRGTWKIKPNFVSLSCSDKPLNNVYPASDIKAELQLRYIEAIER